MKIRTSELTKIQLDWAVLKAAGYEPQISFFIKPQVRGSLFAWMRRKNCYYAPMWGLNRFHPSDSWDHAGPIIEREWITLTPTRSGYWGAEIIHAIPGPLDRYQWLGSGSTPLIAAMRCYVTSKLGDEIDVPEELCND